MIFALLTLVGCGPDESASICREGTSLADDGHCYPPLDPAAPDLGDALAGVCVPAEGPGGLDVARGCANGACAGDTFEELRAVLGDAVGCATASQDPTLVYCTWAELGIDGLFRDQDQDVLPDPSATTDRVHLFGDHVGATAEGAGIGSNVPCFIDSLDLPSRMNAVDVGGELLPRELIWDAYGVFAYDVGDDDGSGQPNGWVDNLYLYGG